MKEKLLIIGASGHGKVVADLALKMNKWKSIAFLDDNSTINLSMGIEIVGKTIDAFKCIEEYDIFVGIGNNSTREKIQEQLEVAGANIPTLIHPRAEVGEQVIVGIGTVIMAGAVINCCTQIGKGCIINTNSTVEHDNFIEDYVHISPGVQIAGSVKVGRGSWIGIGSAIINNVSIAGCCKLGAGSVVVGDINKPGVYVGVPARRVNL